MKNTKKITAAILTFLCCLIASQTQAQVTTFDFTNEPTGESETMDLADGAQYTDSITTLILKADGGVYETPGGIYINWGVTGADGTYLRLNPGTTMHFSIGEQYVIREISFTTLNSSEFSIEPSAGTFSDGNSWKDVNDEQISDLLLTLGEEAAEIQSIVVQYEVRPGQGLIDAAAPTFERNGNNIIISTTTEGASIYYTTDGTAPVVEGTTGQQVELAVSENTYIRAVAGGEGYNTSEESDYDVNWFKVANVTFSYENLQLTLATTTEGATIRYTTDGSEPRDTLASTIYTGPISLTEDCTVRAFAMRSGYDDSDVTSYEFLRSSFTAATPQILRDGSTVTIETATDGATILYTIDGTTPTEGNSLVYTAPFEVTGNCTIQAFATGDGLFPSEVEALDISDFKVASVTFSYDNLLLTLATATEGATIRYTTDGSEPTDTLTSNIYTGPISLTEDCTVRAFAMRSGYIPSDVTSYEFSRSSVTAAKPQILRTGNIITIETATPNAVIRYTIDGSTPTEENGTVYAAPFEVTENCTIQALATGDGLFASEVATLEITDFQVDEVTFSFENLALVLATATEEATIYYTTDNTTPSALNGTVYNGPIQLTADCVVQAIAVKEGWTDSQVATYEFSLSSVTAATPQILRTDNTITIETATSSATIYYTTDGTVPTTTSNIYTAPFEIEGNCTIQAIAAGDNLYTSEVAEYEVNDFKVADVSFSYDNLQLTLTTTTEGASIYYTTDNSVPTQTTGTIYQSPLTLTADCVVQAIAVKEGWTDSEVTTYEFTLSNVTAAKPQILWENGTVTIETATANATIYYTTDGTTPTTESAVYTAPFEVSQNCTIQAIAAGEGIYTSEVAEYEVNDFKVADVSFSYDNLQLTLTTTTEGASIYYTTDNSAPTQTTGTIYQSPLTLTADCVVQAIAVKEGWTDSEVTSYEFTLSSVTAAKPQILRTGNTITIESATANATIYYTTDGTTPTTESAVYAAPFEVSENCTIQAIATGEGLYTSAVETLAIDDFKVADVTFSYGDLELTLATTTEGATIYYTTDNTIPTATNGTVYTAPIALDADVVVRAIAVKEGWNNSEVTTYEFSLADVTAETPQITHEENTITISSATTDATIYYTLDGTTPTTGSTVYSEPFTVVQNGIIRAIAGGSGYNASTVSELVVNWFQVANVAFSYEDLKLSLSTTTPDATIYYTLDGTTPTTNSAIYTEALELTSDCRVKAIAVLDGWNNSEVTTYDFSESAVTVATPQISRSGNTITITTTTPGASIYYTTDGTVPTTASTAYTEPFEIDENCTIQTVATATGLYPSAIESLIISDFKVAEVAFSYDSLQLTLSTTTTGATIYYTTDGTTPTTNSAIYTEPLELTRDCTIRAFAVRSGWDNSNLTSYSFRLTNVTVATPQITRSGNTISITTTTTGADIYYTTDGTEPTTASTAYTAPFDVDENCTIQATAAADGYYTSETANYEVDWFKVANVTFTLNALTLTMETETTGATIYYTTDGTTPTTSRTPYTAPIQLDESCDVRAIAVRNNWYNSDITLYHFNADRNTTATPQITRNGNELVIASSTIGATIHYTTDGTTPTETSATYTAPLQLDGNTVVQAIAYSEAYLPSAVSTYRVDWFKVSSVDFTFEQGTLSMTTETPQATIYFTLDGTTPSTSSTAYTAPVALTENCDVRAIAVRENWHNSEISLYQYTLGSLPAATPEFSRNGNELTITSATPDAVIYYTLDGTVPTTGSTIYTGPITLTENGTVKAIAYAAGSLQSGQASYHVNWFSVANILFSFAGQQLTMSTATTGATIYYTLDGTTPTTGSTIYTGPINITSSCLVQAFGTHANMMNSNISRYELNLDFISTATPVIERVGNTLVMSCATAGATIYYTVDGTVPTAQSGHIYDSPVVLTQNCTVRAIAVASGYRDSGVADYTTDTFRVEDIHIEFVDGFLYLFTETPNATIHYTTDGTTPTDDSEVFSTPIFVTERLNVKAIGMKDGFTSSPITSAAVDPNEVKCAIPTLALNDHLLTISTITSGASIHYTTDGSQPTASSTRYVGPVVITHNCTIRAIAVKDDYRDSDVGSIVVDDFQVELPAIACNANQISISTLTPDATIYYTTDGTTPTVASSLVYDGPFAWDGSSTIQALAVAAGFNNSVVTTCQPSLPTCAAVSIDYDGHSFTLTAADGAAIYYTTDGSNPTTSTFHYTGKTTASGLCTIRAIAVREGANSSVQTIYELPSYFDGETAIVRTAGHLGKALEWYDMDNLTELTVLGNLDDTDFGTIRTARALHTLDLKQVSVAGETLPDQAFQGANFVAVELPAYLHAAGDNLFADCQRLAAISWNVDMSIPANSLADIDNPNLLLYVSRAGYAPANIRNVIVGRQATTITLSDSEGNSNFHSLHPFYAQTITYTHNYTQTSGKGGESRGWETLALPFHVSNIHHATKGDIAPFADQREVAADLPRFWLYTLDASGLVRAGEIEANTPYIISMPNHEDYADRYNLGGSVSFEGKNTTVSASGIQSRSFGRIIMVPNFERVERSPRIFTINRGEPSGIHAEGSIFLPDLRDAQPFEAYTTNSDAAVKAINLFDDHSSSAIDDILSADPIRPGNRQSQTIYDLTGRPVDEGQLQSGTYIINGKKVYIRR